MRLLLRSAALIESWFDMLPPGQQATARALHAVVAGAGPHLGQAVKWGNLVFMAAGLHTLAIAPHKSHLHLQVFRAASLIDQFPELEGSGKGLRYLRLRYGQPLDEPLIADLVSAAVAVAEAETAH